MELLSYSQKKQQQITSINKDLEKETLATDRDVNWDSHCQNGMNISKN